MTTAFVITCPKCEERFTAFRTTKQCTECGHPIPDGVLNFNVGYERQRASIRNRDKFSGDTRKR